MTYDPNEWDAPDPLKLLVSAKRVAAELDVPIWKANEICWCLDRRFYSAGQSHYRVTVASLNAFKELLDMGMSIGAARAVMWQYKQEGGLPPSDLEKETADRIYWRSSRRW
ncbi:hypothetical protein K8W59_19175 [Nocardioides rotundus]|uniref:hypothetical protein n=1 Tax=Nocardioides rotundus TaxID=1774216 RepID=UPI001CBE2495|nr:hypothetical protein [Nocardioides rotundus]UAL29822.1 hypothetical protein K8W59_19175 [Nocardioides rotundus]